MSVPDVQVIGPALLLQGHAVDAVRYAIATTRRARRTNGLCESNVLGEIDRAAAAAAGHAATPPRPEAHAELIDPVTVEELAAMLGRSRRQARRLAPGLNGRLVGGRWFVDAQSVRDHLEGRASA